MPEIPQTVIRKLIGFSLAMIILPVFSFFVVQGLGAGPIWSGGIAAVVANVVLIGYVIVAFTEDLSSVEPGLHSKKEE